MPIRPGIMTGNMEAGRPCDAHSTAAHSQRDKGALMDNVILVTFEDEGKAYEEFNRLKSDV